MVIKPTALSIPQRSRSSSTTKFNIVVVGFSALLLKRINKLIADVKRSPFEGIGKPEPLKENLAGFWSRRIDETNRLVYAVDNSTITIISCRYHY